MTNIPSLDSKKADIAVMGLGYVGLPLAIEFSKVRSVIGFDINEFIQDGEHALFIAASTNQYEVLSQLSQ